MTSKFTIDEDESCEKLNELMHNLMGYHAEESFLEPWTAFPADNFEKAAQVLADFEKIFQNNFIVGRWK
jgi:hypothetical protein